MAKKLFADGVSGDIAIFNPAAPNAFNAPMANLDNVYFHSQLDYMGVAARIETTVTHARQTHSEDRDKDGTSYQPRTGTMDYVLGTHTQGEAAPAVAYSGNAILPAMAELQKAGRSTRLSQIIITATQIILREKYYTFDNDLPAFSQVYKVVLFTKPLGMIGDKTLFITPNQMVASRGKLDTDHRYIQRYDKPGDVPDFYFTAGRTADVGNGRLKIVTPNGTVLGDPEYTGAFTGSPSKGMKA